MGTQTDYFEKIGYKPKYFIGDRVIGKFNSIPFVGTVGNDRVISLAGPEITIHLDLPIKIDKEYKSLIIAKHKDVRRLPEFAFEAERSKQEPLKLKDAGSTPVKRTKQRKK